MVINVLGLGRRCSGLNTCSTSMGSDPKSHILKKCSVELIFNSSAGLADPRGLLASQSSQPVSGTFSERNRFCLKK